MKRSAKGWSCGAVIRARSHTVPAQYTVLPGWRISSVPVRIVLTCPVVTGSDSSIHGGLWHFVACTQSLTVQLLSSKEQSRGRGLSEWMANDSRDKFCKPSGHSRYC